MVVLELGRSNAGLVTFAANLATHMDIGLTSIAACQPMAEIYDQTMILGDYVQEDRNELDVETAVAKTEFEDGVQGSGNRLWVSRGRDDRLALRIHGRPRLVRRRHPLCDRRDQPTIAARRAGISDIVMHADRPVLLVPATVDKPAFDHAVVAWKRTREARRAIADALPLLTLF